MTGRIQDKVAIVIGAAQGIGAEESIGTGDEGEAASGGFVAEDAAPGERDADGASAIGAFG